MEKGIQHLHSGAISVNLTCLFKEKVCLLILPAMSQLCLSLCSQPHLRCIALPKMEVQLFKKPHRAPIHHTVLIPFHLCLELKQGLLEGPACEGTTKEQPRRQGGGAREPPACGGKPCFSWYCCGGFGVQEK